MGPTRKPFEAVYYDVRTQNRKHAKDGKIEEIAILVSKTGGFNVVKTINLSSE